MQSKISFNRPQGRKILYAVLSLLVSLLFWVYVTNTRGDVVQQAYPGINVVFEGETTLRESKGLIVTDDVSVNNVRVTLEGTRRALSNIDGADLTAVVDLSAISKTGSYTVNYKVNFPFGTDTSEINVVSSSPQTISFEVDMLSRKTIDVRGEFTGTVAEGFNAGGLEFSQSTVTLRGPQSVLDLIDHAWVECARENVDRSLTYDSDFILRDADGNEIVIDDPDVELETDVVTVTVPVTAIKTVDLTIRFFDGAGVTSDDVKHEIFPENIILSGDAATLAGINSIVLDEIDLAEFEGTLNETYTIVIPNDTEILGGTHEALVTVELVGIETRTIDVSNLSCTFVPDGFREEIMNNYISVTLRGPEASMRSVTPANVRAVADLSDYSGSGGIISVPVRIEIDGTTDVAAFGEYMLYINLIREDEEE